MSTLRFDAMTDADIARIRESHPGAFRKSFVDVLKVGSWAALVAYVVLFVASFRIRQTA